MRVVGIDLSLTGTGISDGTTTWEVGEDGHTADSLEQRARRRGRLIESILAIVPPDADMVLIEGPSFGSKNGHAWDRAGAWWQLIDRLYAATDARIVEMPPSSLKVYATGKSTAGKPQMLEAAVRRLPAVLHEASDNRVDALWLAAAGYDYLGVPLCDMPATHRKALEKVRWPER